MESTPYDPLLTLADTLRLYLSRPVQLDADAERFVAATYGDAEAKTLRTLFADTSASDAETLLELLLFPDTTLQLRIEPLLGQLNPSAHTERRLCEYLCRPPIDIVVELDANGAPVSMPLSADFLRRFVTRLRIFQRWPRGLDARLTKHLCDADALRARVMLRNSPVEIQDRCAAICGDFVAALTSDHRDFWPALGLLLEVAADLETAADPFEPLTAHKQRAFQMVEQQREFEYRLRRSNLETLLGQGQRAPTLAKADARRRMRLIDTVCLALFARTVYFEPVAFG